MEVTFEQLANLLVIVPSGRLDTQTAPAFDAEVAPLLAHARPRILLDMAGVNYVSSGGLRSMLQLVKHTAAHGGRLGVCSPQPDIMEVMEISGFLTLLDLYPDRESALSQRAS